MGNMAEWYRYGRKEIKVGDNADEVDKFRCESLLQSEDLIVNYYLKIKRCNDVIKLCKNHLKEVFITKK